MSGKILRRFLILGAILLLVLPSIQVAFGNNINSNKAKITIAGDNEHYSNCIIVIIGKCNEVTGPLLWKFGFYCNFFKKDFSINSKGEDGEIINVMVRGGGNFKFIWGKENIKIDLKGATGILFWGGKSIIFDNTYIIARCQAEDAYLTY